MEILPPLSANYASPGLEDDGSGLQTSELSLHDSIHCSLIGCVLEVWILLEWRLLPWCVALVCKKKWLQGRTGSRDLLLLGIAGKSRRTSNNCVLRSYRSRRLQLNQERGRDWFSELSLGIWSAYLLWSRPRALERYGSLSELRWWTIGHIQSRKFSWEER